MYVFGSMRCRRRCGEWMRGLGLGFTNPVGTWGAFDVCHCLGCGGVAGVGGEWVGGRWFGTGSGRVGWCYVCVSCKSGFFV